MPNGTAATLATVYPIDEGPIRIRVSRESVATGMGSPDRPGELSRKKAPGSHVLTETPEDALFLGEGFLPSKQHPPSPRLTQLDLYPARHAFSPEHITALRLLRVAAGRNQRALRALNQNDEVTADSEAQKIQVLLPELFCCRELGDGFGTIVNALMSSFESLRGNTPSASQFRTLARIFELLTDKPFLSADEADQQVELLEAAQLSPYPAELVKFLSNGESVR